MSLSGSTGGNLRPTREGGEKPRWPLWMPLSVTGGYRPALVYRGLRAWPSRGQEPMPACWPLEKWADHKIAVRTLGSTKVSSEPVPFQSRTQTSGQCHVKVLLRSHRRPSEPASLEVGQMMPGSMQTTVFVLRSNVDFQGPFKRKESWDFIIQDS